MRLKYHKIDFWGQFITLCVIIMSLIIEWLKWLEGISIIGLSLLIVFGVWQVISALYNSMCYENIPFRKHLNMYWAITIPTVILLLLQYAELIKEFGYVEMGTFIASCLMGFFYLYVQYIFIYKETK